MHGQIGGGNSGPDVIPFASTKSTSRIGIADKPASDACFNDWKRFCFVLREIASGENGCPLSAVEAQKRAQAVLAECGYAWPGQIQVRRPVAAPVKSVGKAPSRSARRNDPAPREHRISAPLNGRPTQIVPTHVPPSSNCRRLSSE
jgi:hypothetical protein